ncbi:Glutathione synthetase like protein [Argiope bruennichi]|uniref:Glutathione synthetase n=1 Tax=Argiope bruennichi TaxID=94029 RepID=A0A8T0F2B5_ARGBR|nr:Glutathione synthetase like protein [Argiope bruennichi]
MDVRVPVPVCLVPSPFPKTWFQHVGDLQPYLNFILHKVAYSKDILKECLASTMEVDEFTRNIFKIYEAVEHDEQLSLGLIRSDYLLNSDSEGRITGIKQVENNTIASSFGGLAPIVRELHEFVLERLGLKGFESRLPTNQSVFTLAQGIISAWDAYTNTSAVVLFVVEDVTYNICDQRALEYALLEYESRLEVLRCSFKELRTCAVLKGRTLLVKDKEVAVVYYRNGYMPDQLEPEDWEVRLLMERSKAIKCPSVGLHLAGTKKVQLYLSKPGVLERFVKKEIAEQIRELFVGQYALDMGPDGDKAVQMGIKDPDKYVLKPEREGGGNNLYGEDLKNLLEKIQDSEERKAYILMERINPPLIPNCIIRRDNKPEFTNVICELGIFGTILGSGCELLFIHITTVSKNASEVLEKNAYA